MSPEHRNLRKMPDELLNFELDQLKAEQSRRLTEAMEQAQSDIDEVLKKYPQLREGNVLRVALGRRQAQEAKRYMGHSQKFGSVSISHVQNIYPDPSESHQQSQIQESRDASESDVE